MSDRIEKPFSGPPLDPERTEKVVFDLLRAMHSEDVDGFMDAIDLLYYSLAWRRAFLTIRRQANPSDQFKTEMRRIWARSSGKIRNGVGDDGLVVDCARKLLTPYEGGDLVLYRGETFGNRCRKTYGFCWSADERVAHHYARNSQRTFRGGSVVLKALVPRAAIVSNIHAVSRYPKEVEYTVDRRYLTPGSVRVIARYPQAFAEDLAA